MNAHVANGDDFSRPLAFFQVWNIGQKNVGAQAAMVNVQVARSSVSGDKQRKDVKGLWRRDLLQCHGFTGGFKHKLQSFGGVPEMAVDRWHAVSR